jgi:hypothetical protein
MKCNGSRYVQCDKIVKVSKDYNELVALDILETSHHILVGSREIHYDELLVKLFDVMSFSLISF